MCRSLAIALYFSIMKGVATPVFLKRSNMQESRKFFQYYTHMQSYPIPLGMKILLIEYFFYLAGQLPNRGEVDAIPDGLYEVFLERTGKAPRNIQELFYRDFANNRPSAADYYECEVDETESPVPGVMEFTIEDIATFMTEVGNSNYWTEYKQGFNDFMIRLFTILDPSGSAVKIVDGVIVDIIDRNIGIVEGKMNKRVSRAIERIIYEIA